MESLTKLRKGVHTLYYTYTNTHLSDEIFETRPRYLLISQSLRFVHISLQYNEAYREVGLVKVVRYIPADLTILSSLLQYGVKKRQNKHDGGERWVATFCVCVQGNAVKRTSQVQLQTIRRLSYDLKNESSWLLE